MPPGFAHKLLRVRQGLAKVVILPSRNHHGASQVAGQKAMARSKWCQWRISTTLDLLVLRFKAEGRSRTQNPVGFTTSSDPPCLRLREHGPDTGPGRVGRILAAGGRSKSRKHGLKASSGRNMPKVLLPCYYAVTMLRLASWPWPREHRGEVFQKATVAEPVTYVFTVYNTCMYIHAHN